MLWGVVGESFVNKRDKRIFCPSLLQIEYTNIEELGYIAKPEPQWSGGRRRPSPLLMAPDRWTSIQLCLAKVTWQIKCYGIRGGFNWQGKRAKVCLAISLLCLGEGRSEGERETVTGEERSRSLLDMVITFHRSEYN